jgi:hypothetical protein
VGETVTFLGFGWTDVRQSGSGGKLFEGTNKVAKVGDGKITLEKGAHWTENNESTDSNAPLPGDSGGPLFNSSDELIGITSTSVLEGAEGRSFFVDLHSEKSREFFRKHKIF